MSADDHLSPDQFFHGTHVELQPGDMVEPGHPARHVRTHGASGDYAYAASRAQDAGFFGRHVYQVAPTGPLERDPEDVWNMGFHRSSSPMRVVGKL